MKAYAINLQKITSIKIILNDKVMSNMPVQQGNFLGGVNRAKTDQNHLLGSQQGDFLGGVYGVPKIVSHESSVIFWGGYVEWGGYIDYNRGDLERTGNIKNNSIFFKNDLIRFSPIKGGGTQYETDGI